ncbi:proteophosphoglycan ppg4 [Variovorax sp. 770b2]|uniref:proteophosphoglycan ppg4 n=1 Tax=Variovorax sp. 770b2 TaxID=1566271 RepID=UPI0008E4E3E0|nr:proteophosphoglycan ppg4 [Variovorax sp. 770b2]SFP37300.1 hypothetical protein SAMN03159339_1978 [Variovorax sp. 770b2]
MNRTSSLIAALALGAAGIAFAQGNPPTTASPNPATGAGQQSPAGGPMGATGTMPQSGTSGAAAPMSQGSTGTSSSSANSSSSGTSGSNSTMSSEPPMRQARADRN